MPSDLTFEIQNAPHSISATALLHIPLGEQTVLPRPHSWILEVLHPRGRRREKGKKDKKGTKEGKEEKEVEWMTRGKEKVGERT